jgi:hypothetical protein
MAVKQPYGQYRHGHRQITRDLGTSLAAFYLYWRAKQIQAGANMADVNDIDYGPLTGLIGTWQGERGIDIAPEPDDTERTPFTETLVFEAAGDVTNAEEQTLAILHYRQKVYKISNGEQFHDQVGYWTWDPATGTISNTFVIPRRVAVVAGGKVTADGDDGLTITVDAADGDKDWGISQSPFMRDKARSVSFNQILKLNGDEMSYEETTVLDIYGRSFNHKDKSRLIRVTNNS